jgi:hypothetical protein
MARHNRSGLFTSDREHATLPVMVVATQPFPSFA